MAKLNRKDIYPKNKQQTLHEITIYMLYLRIFFDSTRAIKRIPPSRAPAAVAPETTQSFSAHLLIPSPGTLDAQLWSDNKLRTERKSCILIYIHFPLTTNDDDNNAPGHPAWSIVVVAKGKQELRQHLLTSTQRCSWNIIAFLVVDKFPNSVSVLLKSALTSLFQLKFAQQHKPTRNNNN